jgi:hypothetical protein
MICDVFDNIFDSLYLHETFAKISQMPVNFTNVANRKTRPYGYVGSHVLLGYSVFSRIGLNNITTCDEQHFSMFYEMYEMIESYLNHNFYLSAITTNVQPMGCDGTTHMDAEEDENDEYTILVMTNPEWKKEWGGQFQLIDKSTTLGKDGHVVEEHEYVPGRVILIPSSHPHRGLGPKEKYIYRTSVVFRVTPNFGKHIPGFGG